MGQKLRYLMVFLGLMLSLGIFAQTTKWRDIYTVKKKDTVFGIANKYGLTLPELMDANPAMKKEGYMLKKGDTIFIPFEKNGANANGTSAASSASGKLGASQNVAKSGSVQKKANTVQVGVMLPLHDVDGDGRRMVEYYRGILMACEKLKQQGISTDIHGTFLSTLIFVQRWSRRVLILATSSLDLFTPSRLLLWLTSARRMVSKW